MCINMTAILAPNKISIRDASKVQGARRALREYHNKEPYIQNAIINFRSRSEYDHQIPLPFYAFLHTAVTEFGQNLAGKKILQIACNWAPYLHYLGKKFSARTYGIDADIDAVRFALTYGKSNLIVGSASSLPFPKNSFDLVISYNFLDISYLVQLNGPRIAGVATEIVLGEACRVLKPGGKLFSHFEFEDRDDKSLQDTLSRINFSAWDKIYFTFADLSPVTILTKHNTAESSMRETNPEILLEAV